MSNLSVQVEGIGKQYQLGLREKANQTFREAIVGMASAPLRRLKHLSGREEQGKFWALRDISFDVPEGEVLGVIGHNGAGKSTLLKILSRITEPTEGRAIIHGRVASLLEVGTGFHNELSGRENVYLNGAILGMAKSEIDRKFDEIVDFSGVEKFLDTPIKRFSSGMKVRLAFAVAAHLEPEILIIDEVLAVGDQEFQNRCLGKMQDVATSGRTVLFVSHNMAAVSQLCQRAIVLNQGSIEFDGTADKGVSHYLRKGNENQDRVEFAPDESKRIQITQVRLQRETSEPATMFRVDEPIHLAISYRVTQPTRDSYICFSINSSHGHRVLWSCDVEFVEELSRTRERGVSHLVAEIPAQVLAPGRYSCHFAVYDPGSKLLHDHIPAAVSFDIDDPTSLLARFGLAHQALTSISARWTSYEAQTC